MTYAQAADDTSTNGKTPDQTPPEDRVSACIKELEAVLEKHKCRLTTQMGAGEPVGIYGDRMIIGAVPRVVPLPQE